MENKQGRKLAVAKELNVELDGEIVCEIMYTIWTGKETLEQEVEWNIGVKLNKEQAERAQETNAGTGLAGDVETLTEGYYITEMDRFGDFYYRMENEEELIKALLEKYSFVMEEE